MFLGYVSGKKSAPHQYGPRISAASKSVSLYGKSAAQFLSDPGFNFAMSISGMRTPDTISEAEKIMGQRSEFDLFQETFQS